LEAAIIMTAPSADPDDNDDDMIVTLDNDYD
jgi:hypothetical protein